jgi:hypothetical protein
VEAERFGNPHVDSEAEVRGSLERYACLRTVEDALYTARCLPVEFFEAGAIANQQACSWGALTEASNRR